MKVTEKAERKLAANLLGLIYDHWPPITAVLLVLGTILWRLAGVKDHQALFNSLQFLALNRDIPNDIDGVPIEGWVRSALFVIQVLLPVMVSLAFVKTVFHDYFSPMVARRKARKMEGHIVVAGCGTFGRHLVDLHRGLGDIVLILELSESVSRILDAKGDKGVVCLLGDAGNQELLSHANLHKAQKIYVVTGDDDRNIRVLSEMLHVLGAVLAGERSARTTVRVQLDSVEAKLLYSAQEGFKLHCEECVEEEPESVPPLVEVLDIHEMAARVLFLRYAPLICETSARTFVVVGHSPLAESFVLTAARLGQIDAPEGRRGETLRVVWIGLSVENRESFLARYPCLRQPEYAQKADWRGEGVAPPQSTTDLMSSEVFPLIELFMDSTAAEALRAPGALVSILADVCDDIFSVVVCTPSDTLNLALSRELCYQLKHAGSAASEHVIATSYGTVHPASPLVKYFNVPSEASRVIMGSESLMRAGRLLNQLYAEKEPDPKDCVEKILPTQSLLRKRVENVLPAPSSADALPIDFAELDKLRANWLAGKSDRDASENLWYNASAEDRLSNIESVAHILFKLAWLARPASPGEVGVVKPVFSSQDIMLFQHALFREGNAGLPKLQFDRERIAQLAASLSRHGNYLARLEHQRWLAFKLLHGYRFDPRKMSGEERRQYRLNKDIKPFAELENPESKKDEIIIRAMPLVLLLLLGQGEDLTAGS